MRILFLTPRYPYPAYKGDQLRAGQVIRALSAKHEVTTVSFRPRGVRDAEARAQGIETLPFRAGAAVAGVVAAGLSGAPFQTGLYGTRAMRALVADLVRACDVVHLNTLRMATTLPAELDKPLVVDFVDALSASTARYGEASAWPKSWVIGEEARRLGRFERRLAEGAAFACAVSATDAEAIAPGVAVVRHGVDTERFHPPEESATRSGVVFTGNLAYPPNDEAARVLMREVFPLVRRRVPDATLRIVGVGASRGLHELSSEGVSIVGEVASVAEELRSAAVAVAPIRFGGGVQTKILEAMACGTPVVATPFANNGIDAVDGESILVRESAEALAESIADLLESAEHRKTIGGAGRAHVETHFAVEAALRPLISWYDDYR